MEELLQRIEVLEAQIKGFHEFFGELVEHSNNVAYYVRVSRGNIDGMGNVYTDDDPRDIQQPEFLKSETNG